MSKVCPYVRAHTRMVYLQIDHSSFSLDLESMIKDASGELSIMFL